MSTPAHQDAVWVTAKDHPWRRAHDGDRVQDGDLVAFASGCSTVAISARSVAPGRRRRHRGARALFERSDALHDRLIGACRPGAANAELLAAYEAAGEALPVVPVAHGLGAGFDSRSSHRSSPATAAAERQEQGMVLAVTGYVFESGVGAVFRRDVVLITEDGADVLTSAPAWSA